MLLSQVSCGSGLNGIGSAWKLACLKWEVVVCILKLENMKCWFFSRSHHRNETSSLDQIVMSENLLYSTFWMAFKKKTWLAFTQTCNSYGWWCRYLSPCGWFSRNIIALGVFSVFCFPSPCGKFVRWVSLSSVRWIPRNLMNSIYMYTVDLDSMWYTAYNWLMLKLYREERILQAMDFLGM